MTYIAYTICENGFRFFADLAGVCVSYDPKLIKQVIAERDGTVQRNKLHVQAMEEQVQQMKEHQSLPPIFDVITEHNRRVVTEQAHETKRIVTAEAVIHDQLVRDVMYFDDIKEAMAYTFGIA